MRYGVIHYLPYFLSSFIIAILSVPLFRSLSWRVGALDRGGGRRVHAGVIPRLGGGGIFCAFLLPAAYLVLTSNNTGRLSVILLTSVIVFALGVYDDIKVVRIKYKLFFEIVAALLMYYKGVRVIRINGGFELGWLSLPVTVIWILTVTNAINLIDGLDGLAAGTGILVAITLFLVSGGGERTSFICVLLIGGLAGFLIYNFPPASVFMGDSGSLFTGFILASLSAASSAKASTMTALMVPILAFGVPLMDMLYAVLRRYYRGLPLGQADKEHIHHKLLEKGFSRKKVLLLLYTINASIMFICLLFIRQYKLMGMGVLAVLPVFLILGLRFFGYIEFIPFMKEAFRNFEKNRKGRYHSYMVRRFRQKANRADSVDLFSAGLRELMKLEDIGKMEIILDRNAGNGLGLAGYKMPDFIFLGSVNPKRAFTVAYPIICKDQAFTPILVPKLSLASGGLILGQVRMTGCSEGDFPLYCAEVAQALSEEVSGFLVKAASLAVREPAHGGSQAGYLYKDLRMGPLDPVFHK